MLDYEFREQKAQCRRKAKMSALSKVKMSVSCASRSRDGGGRSDERGADEQTRAEPDRCSGPPRERPAHPRCGRGAVAGQRASSLPPEAPLSGWGPAGIADRRRGRPSNNRLPDALRDHAVALVREHYADFGPTLAAEKLEDRHDLRVSRETLRSWMIQAGVWRPRAERKRFHQPRHRREHLGELIQIDGCEHRWFEDRGPPCTLLVFVDDATSRLMALGFVPSESTFAYFEVLSAIWRRTASLSPSTPTSTRSSGSTRRMRQEAMA